MELVLYDRLKVNPLLRIRLSVVFCCFLACYSHGQTGAPTLQWEPGTSPPQPFRYHIAVAHDTAIYIVGGDNEGAFAGYVPTSDSWTQLAPLPTPRMFLAGAILHDTLYTMGGLGTTLAYSDIMEKYDFASRRWTAGPALPEPMCRFAAVALQDQIYLIGGLSGHNDRHANHSSAVYAYHPRTATWTQRAPLPFPLHGHGAIAYDGKILVFGGYTREGPAGQVLMYHPEADSWISRAEMPTPRGFLQVVVINNSAYAIGGRGRLRDGPVECYDPDHDQWTILEPLTQPIMRFGAATIGRQVFLIGGEEQPYKMLIGTFVE